MNKVTYILIKVIINEMIKLHQFFGFYIKIFNFHFDSEIVDIICINNINTISNIF